MRADTTSLRCNAGSGRISVPHARAGSSADQVDSWCARRRLHRQPRARARRRALEKGVFSGDLGASKRRRPRDQLAAALLEVCLAMVMSSNGRVGRESWFVRTPRMLLPVLMGVAVSVGLAVPAGAVPLVSECHISHDLSCGRESSVVGGMIAEGSLRHLASQSSVLWTASAFPSSGESLRAGPGPVTRAAVVRFSRLAGSNRVMVLSLAVPGLTPELWLQDPGHAPVGVQTVPDSVVLLCLASVLAGLGAATRRFRMTPPSRRAAPWIIRKEAPGRQPTDISSRLSHPVELFDATANLI